MSFIPASQTSLKPLTRLSDNTQSLGEEREMRVLVACEFSGTVRDAFKRKGHHAISCDLLSTESPGLHYRGDVLELFKSGNEWDLLIAHPPCTYLTVAANKWMKPEYRHRFPDRPTQRQQAILFFMELWNSPIKRVCIENPVGIMSTAFQKPNQIIQPWQFGHTDRKTTCLWLRGLPPLFPTRIVKPNIKRNRNGKTASVHHDAALRLPAEERWKVRSKTYQGIADAMADQWGAMTPNKEE